MRRWPLLSLLRAGNTALTWAAKNGHATIVEALLGAGADVNLQGYNGAWGAQRELGVRGVGTGGPRVVCGASMRERDEGGGECARQGVGHNGAGAGVWGNGQAWRCLCHGSNMHGKAEGACSVFVRGVLVRLRRGVERGAQEAVLAKARVMMVKMLQSSCSAQGCGGRDGGSSGATAC